MGANHKRCEDVPVCVCVSAYASKQPTNDNNNIICWHTNIKRIPMKLSPKPYAVCVCVVYIPHILAKHLFHPEFPGERNNYSNFHHKSNLCCLLVFCRSPEHIVAITKTFYILYSQQFILRICTFFRKTFSDPTKLNRNCTEEKRITDS